MHVLHLEPLLRVQVSWELSGREAAWGSKRQADLATLCVHSPVRHLLTAVWRGLYLRGQHIGNNEEQTDDSYPLSEPWLPHQQNGAENNNGDHNAGLRDNVCEKCYAKKKILRYTFFECSTGKQTHLSSKPFIFCRGLMLHEVF